MSKTILIYLLEMRQEVLTRRTTLTVGTLPGDFPAKESTGRTFTRARIITLDIEMSIQGSRNNIRDTPIQIVYLYSDSLYRFSTEKDLGSASCTGRK